jgi:hypothetical protein
MSEYPTSREPIKLQNSSYPVVVYIIIYRISPFLWVTVHAQLTTMRETEARSFVALSCSLCLCGSVAFVSAVSCCAVPFILEIRTVYVDHSYTKGWSRGIRKFCIRKGLKKVEHLEHATLELLQQELGMYIPAAHSYDNCHTFNWTETELLGWAQTKYARGFKEAWYSIDGNTITRHVKAFLIPWTGEAFAPLGPFLCHTTEEKKLPIAPKPGP